MKVWVVQMICGVCGDSEWGGVYSNEVSALKKQEEMNEEYKDRFHRHYADCTENEVKD